MTAQERRSSLGLALVFVLRMLGLFLVVPVFALEAQNYANASPASIGLAMGAYGLTQALLQLPFGMAADRIGRKRVIVAGLLVFAVGSVVAAQATTIEGLLIGRAVQGAGAVSAAVTALLADQTRDVVRTKAMAIIGGSIGVVFMVSLVLSPLLNSLMGLGGMFWLVAILALLAIVAVLGLVPAEPARTEAAIRGSLSEVLFHPQLWRLNLGVFVLHAVQLGMWMVVPALLVHAGLLQAQHWHVYLPAMLLSLLVMGGVLFRLERQGKLKAVFLFSIGLIILVQVAFMALAPQTTLSPWLMGLLLTVFFTGFNMLEASQPSLVSRLAPEHARGMALGLYNTAQALGLFVGGAVGGLLMKNAGSSALFAGSITLLVVWLWCARSMQTPASLRESKVVKN
mgnify:FL=1